MLSEGGEGTFSVGCMELESKNNLCWQCRLKWGHQEENKVRNGQTSEEQGRLGKGNIKIIEKEWSEKGV